MKLQLPVSIPADQSMLPSQGVQRTMVLVVNFFVFWKLFFLCFVVAIFDLVHDVEAIVSIP